MSSQIARVMVPPSVAMPRGAVWASSVPEMLLRLGRRAWRGLEAIGRARGRRELLRLAASRSAQPDFALQLRDAARRAALTRE